MHPKSTANNVSSRLTSIALWTIQALLRIRPRLTALAAGLLAIEMTVATGFTLVTIDVAQAVLPLVVTCLAALVAYGRRTMAPRRERSRASLQPASYA